MSEWLDVLLGEVDRKATEAGAARDESARRHGEDAAQPADPVAEDH